MVVATKTSHVLVVEDNPGDVWLVKSALEMPETPQAAVTISVAADGMEALEFLRHQNAFADSPRPDLIVLDLNLPRVSGHDVLQEIKNDPSLKSIPVVVLTSSSAEEDIRLAYEHSANCYITKPFELSKYMEAMHRARQFWLETVKLPPGDEE